MELLESPLVQGKTDNDCYIQDLNRQQGQDLQLVLVPAEVVNRRAQELPESITDDEAEDSADAALAVSQEVLRQLFVKAVVHEVAGYRKPQEEEEDDVGEEVLDLVAEVEAEEQLVLRKHQEEDDLEVPVHHDQPDVAPEGEGPDQLGNLVVKEKLEEQIHDQESQDHKDEVQSQVVVAVRQQVFPFAFVMNELRL